MKVLNELIEDHRNCGGFCENSRCPFEQLLLLEVYTSQDEKRGKNGSSKPSRSLDPFQSDITI